MSGGFEVTHLRCAHCGNELPVMGRVLTFQCGTCFRHWIMTEDGLRPLDVYRAAYSEAPGADMVFLPFWVFPLDAGHLRGQLEETPERKEISSMVLRRLGPSGDYHVFVPGFEPVNPHACLKIGRLLTSRQPSYRASRTSDPGITPACVLGPGEAEKLVDLVFIATLPEPVLMSGRFLQDLVIRPSSRPRLVEFPFERKGSALRSVHGDFEVSMRLASAPANKACLFS